MEKTNNMLAKEVADNWEQYIVKLILGRNFYASWKKMTISEMNEIIANNPYMNDFASKYKDRFAYRIATVINNHYFSSQYDIDRMKMRDVYKKVLHTKRLDSFGNKHDMEQLAMNEFNATVVLSKRQQNSILRILKENNFILDGTVYTSDLTQISGAHGKWILDKYFTYSR